jgi:hypothetical protein
MRLYRAARRSQALPRFLAGLRNERNVHRAAAACAGLISRFGGVDAFARAWKAQIEAAQPGSPLALNAFWAVIKLAQLCGSADPRR